MVPASNSLETQLLLVADRVGRSYGTGPTAFVAVHDVTCVIAPGEHIALVGPSGSGKTTLIHLLGGLDVPTTGTIGWPAIGPVSSLRPGPIAIVFQSPSLLPPLDVIENVMLPLQLAGQSDESARNSAREALEALDLGGLANKLPEELSGGQAQRVAVARALAGRPKLILADEPTGQLDSASGKRVIELLIQAAATSGAALLLNTHDLAMAERLNIRWTMADGRLVAPSVVGELVGESR